MKHRKRSSVTRRGFLKGSVAGAAGFVIVPPHVLGGPDHTPPSETVGGALIGVGGQGPNTFETMQKQFREIGHEVRQLAQCDVRFLDRADDETFYTDFRRVLERRDIDVVAIATPPHWHALISIAAAQAGKDVLCEKPMTRFIAEGRAVANAFRRYGRVFQVGTFGRFDASRDRGRVTTHKIMRSGLLKSCPAVHIQRGDFKVKRWSGGPALRPEVVPENLDWDMYCGPSPLKPYVRDRVGGTHRNYWDYEGGGLSDMGQHHLDGVQWTYGKDDTSPVEIEAHAPPADAEVTGVWGWVELKYADGLTLVLDSGEWGEPYSRKPKRELTLNDLSEADRKTVEAAPDPEPLLTFAEAVKARKQAGGNAESSHRGATLLHLANIAIRTGRKLRFDPVTERVIGDEEANRLVDQPMRAPWHYVQQEKVHWRR